MKAKEIWPLVRNAVSGWVKGGWSFMRETISEWTGDNASRLAAAIAYYTMFSLAPLLVIAVAIAGFIFGKAAATNQIYGSLSGVVGPDAATMIQGLVRSVSRPDQGAVATIISVITLLIAASGLFGALRGALNTIWDVSTKPGAGILGTIKKRGLQFLMVLGIGFLLLASLLASTALAILRGHFQSALPGLGPFWQVVNLAVFLAIITVLFAAIYKVLPDVKIQWKYLWIGAGITALLFVIGEYLISLYLGFSSVGTMYGAAGSLFIVLLWVYYSAQVFFFGAEFTQVYARRRGAYIVPADNAVWIDAAGPSGKKALQAEAGRGKEQESQPASTGKLSEAAPEKEAAKVDPPDRC